MLWTFARQVSSWRTSFLLLLCEVVGARLRFPGRLQTDAWKLSYSGAVEQQDSTMKSIFTLLLFLTLNGSAFASSNGFNPNELTYVVTLRVNEKTDAQINEFSALYQALVEGNEPGTLAWQFYRGVDERIYLIERYADPDAALQHVINISAGGIQEKEFREFSDHFVIEDIIIYGSPSNNLVESLEAIGLPLEFRSIIAGYSRN